MLLTVPHLIIAILNGMFSLVVFAFSVFGVYSEYSDDNLAPQSPDFGISIFTVFLVAFCGLSLIALGISSAVSMYYLHIG